jgi:hypothetical protein
MSPGCRLSNVESRLSRLSHVGCRLSHVASLILAFVAFSALPEPAYTNHAGNAVPGIVVALDARTATISNAAGRMLYLSPYEPQGAKLDKREMHIRAHALVDWALGHSHDHLEAWP